MRFRLYVQICFIIVGYHKLIRRQFSLHFWRFVKDKLRKRLHSHSYYIPFY